MFNFLHLENCWHSMSQCLPIDLIDHAVESVRGWQSLKNYGAGVGLGEHSRKAVGVLRLPAASRKEL